MHAADSAAGNDSATRLKDLFTTPEGYIKIVIYRLIVNLKF